MLDLVHAQGQSPSSPQVPVRPCAAIPVSLLRLPDQTLAQREDARQEITSQRNRLHRRRAAGHAPAVRSVYKVCDDCDMRESDCCLTDGVLENFRG